MSASATRGASTARSFSSQSSGRARVRPWSSMARSAGTSNPATFAPMLSAAFRASSRMSTAVTEPPSRLAVAIAWRPTTPPPTMRNLAALIVPIAVPSNGMNLGNLFAASSTDL